MTWVSTERAMELLDIKRSRLYEMISSGKIATRPAGTAANGKPRREIDVESLPAQAQIRFYDCPPGSAEAASPPEEDGVNPPHPAASALINLSPAIETLELAAASFGMKLAKVVISGRKTWLGSDWTPAKKHRAPRRKAGR